MTPKEKAQDIYESFAVLIGEDAHPDKVKQCALIIVDETVTELKEWGAPYLFEEATANDWAEDRMKYWEDVKAELLKK